MKPTKVLTFLSSIGIHAKSHALSEKRREIEGMWKQAKEKQTNPSSSSVEQSVTQSVFQFDSYTKRSPRCLNAPLSKISFIDNLIFSFWRCSS